MDNIKIKMNAKMLKNMLNIINTLSGSDNAHRIKFSKRNISFNSVDPAHVAMINQKIPVKNIEEYQFKENVEIGLNIAKMLNSLKNIKKTDIINIDYIEEKNTVYTKIGPFNNKINTLDLECVPDPKKPILDLPVKSIINLKEFYDFIDQAGKISDYVEISTYNDKLFLFAENDTDQVKIIYNKENLKQLEARDKGQVYISLFAVDYLKMIVRHLKTQYKECTIVFGTDTPIKIICNEETETEVLLAPRIDEGKTNKDRVKRAYNDIEEIIEESEVKPEETIKEEAEAVKIEAEEEKEIIADVDNNLYPNGEKPQEEEVKEELKKLEKEIKQKETVNPEIKPSGDIVEINGQIVQLFTSEELEEAAKLFKKYNKEKKANRYKRFLKSLHWSKTHDKQIKDISLYQGIDPVIIIDVLEKYDYTWHKEV